MFNFYLLSTFFAKRNAPYVPVRQNLSNKRNEAQQQKNVPKQQYHYINLLLNKKINYN